MTQKLTLSLLLLCSLLQSLFAQSGQQMFNETYVHEIRIYFDEPNFWSILTQHYEVSVDTTLENVPLPARVVIDGVAIDSVGITQKGYYSNWGAGNALKKPLKLDFNEYNQDGKFDGLKSLNLQNAFMDPSLMRDMLSYRILRDFGVAAPRSSYSKVFINDQYWGLYVSVESINKTFLKEHFGNNDGNLYKANYSSLQYMGDDQNDYAHDFELKTNETENDWSGLIQFIRLVNETGDNVFQDSLERHFAMDDYFKSLALDVSINNWDSHFEHGRNFYLYDNPEDGKFHWIPWDYNLAFDDGFGGDYDIALEVLRSMPGYDKVLPKRVLDNEDLRQNYLRTACELHHKLFTMDYLDPIIESTRVLIKADLEADPNKFYPEAEYFELSLTEGFIRTVNDTLFIQDSIWNGSSWEFTETFFVWQYEEQVPGLRDIIERRNASVQDELTNIYEIDCSSPVQEPGNFSHELRLEAWPNPVNDWLHLQVSESGMLTMYDVHGRIQKQINLKQADIKFSVQDLSPGVYFLAFTNQHGKIVRKINVAP